MATFTNQATLSYNNTITTSNIATGQLLEALSATKTALIDTYRTDDSLTYVISIVNAGTNPLIGLEVTDDLGAYSFDATTLYPLSYVENSAQLYVNGILQPTPTITAGPPLVVSGINIPAGGNAILIYEASVNQYAPLGADSTIVNTAEISGAGLSAPVSVEETVTAGDSPELTISKSIFPNTVTENSPLTYTFLIQNYGSSPAAATDNAVITDVFNPVLSNLTVTFNGVTWTEGVNYNYDAATGLFTTIGGQITVPAATYTQDPTTGIWVTSPGSSTLTVTGII